MGNKSDEFFLQQQMVCIIFLRPRFQEQIVRQPTLGAIVRAADLGSDSET